MTCRKPPSVWSLTIKVVEIVAVGVNDRHVTLEGHQNSM